MLASVADARAPAALAVARGRALGGLEVLSAAPDALLLRLTETTDETSHLAIPCDDSALIVAVQDSPHPLRAASRPGFLAELHCSSTGKVFLAYLHRARIAEIIAASPPTARTPLTLTRGHAAASAEDGVRCLAAPVFASDGTVVAAIGITAATVRFPEKRIPEMAAKVRTVASELSRLMGYTEHAAERRAG